MAVIDVREHGAVGAVAVDMLTITGNQWDNRSYRIAPVNVDGSSVSVSGNSSGNDGRIVATLAAPTTLTARSGERVYFLNDGASVTLPAAAGNSCRITCKNLSGSGARVAAATGESVDRQSGISVPPGCTVELLSDGKAWWTL